MLCYVICLTIILSTNFFYVWDKRMSFIYSMQRKSNETKFNASRANVLFPCLCLWTHLCPKTDIFLVRMRRRESEWMSCCTSGCTRTTIKTTTIQPIWCLLAFRMDRMWYFLYAPLLVVLLLINTIRKLWTFLRHFMLLSCNDNSTKVTGRK